MVNFMINHLRNNNLYARIAVALQRNKNKVMLRASKCKWPCTPPQQYNQALSAL